MLGAVLNVSKPVYKIRPANLDDAALLPAIERSAGELFRSNPDLAWVADDEVQSAERHAELIAKGGAWVAVDGNQGPVAFLNGEEIGGCFHIWEMSVHQQHQRQGLGSRLVNHARQYALENGYRALTLTTFKGVDWNDGFYSSLGFGLVRRDQLSAELTQILDNEIKAGLPATRRCAMAMLLKAENP